MKRKFVEKCFSLLIAGVFIFNVVMPYGWVSADESILDNLKYQNGFITTTVGNSYIAGSKTQTLSYNVMMGNILGGN